MHVSDLPPPADVAEKDVLQRPNAPKTRAATAAPAPASAASPVAKPSVDPELEARMRRSEQDRQAAQKREEERVSAAKADNCARARSSLRTLESGVRIARVNDKGEREIMEDKERAAEMQRARDTIAADCH